MGFFSLLATWVLIGIWHGFGTSSVVWGIYFAVLLFLEGFVLGESLAKIPPKIHDSNGHKRLIYIIRQLKPKHLSKP